LREVNAAYARAYRMNTIMPDVRGPDMNLTVP
jgi:hypothetical protein